MDTEYVLESLGAFKAICFDCAKPSRKESPGNVYNWQFPHCPKRLANFSEGGFGMGWDYQDLLVVFPDVGTSCLRKDLGFLVLQLAIPVASYSWEKKEMGWIFFGIKGTICLSEGLGSPCMYVNE